MKKIISFICVIAIIMSIGATSYAAGIDAMTKECKSYNSKAEYSVEVNKPLDVLGLLEEVSGVDVQYIVEELLNTVVVADVKCEMSEDYLKAKIYTAYNLKMPVNISEDLKFAADVTSHMWIEYDLSSVDKAKFILIFKNPVDGTYIYIDMFDEMFNPEVEEMKALMVETYKALNLKESIAEIAALSKKMYDEHAVVTETADGYTQISFTNDSLVDFVIDYYVGLLDTEYMKNALYTEGLEVTGFEADQLAIAMAKTTVKGLSLFSDEEAFTIKYKTDKNGYMEKAEEKIHLQFNIFELAQSFGASEDDIYPITKENGDIDITFVTNVEYSGVNGTVVEMPALTNDNCISFYEVMIQMYEGYQYYDDGSSYEEDEIYYRPEKFHDYAKGKMERGGMYVDVEEFLLSARWDDDNLTGAVNLWEDGVSITFTSDAFGTVNVLGNLKEDSYLLNETQLWARKPFVKVSEYNWDTYSADEKVYVHIDVLNYIFGAKIESMEVYLLDDKEISLTEPEYYFYIVRPNMAYTGE